METPTASFRIEGASLARSPLVFDDDVSDRATQVVDARVRPSTDPFPHVGEVVQGFQFLSELGRGAMGRVYLAQQQAPTSRVVVLKVGEHLSSECEKLAKLQHPNIVPVYSFHKFGFVQAVCMPYRGPLTLAHLVSRLRNENLQTLDGRALTTVIEECRKGRQRSVAVEQARVPSLVSPADSPSHVNPPESTADSLFSGLRGLNYVDAILTIFRQIVDGLRFAHGEQIVHCDLKPENVLISDDGCAQLIDFGVAFDKSEIAGECRRLGGTRPYMSPEHLHSFATKILEYDERSDLYSVGVMLYELLTGRVPFDTDSDPSEIAIEREREGRYATPVPVRSLNPRVPVAVASIIDKCIRPELTSRYQNSAELLDDLDRQIARRPLRFAPNESARELLHKWTARNRMVLIAVGILALGGVATAGLAHQDRSRKAEIRQLELVAVGEPLAANLNEAEFYFGLAEKDPEYRERAWEIARRALERLQAWDDRDWFSKTELQSLPPERLASYRQQVAGLMLLLANSIGQTAARETDSTKREEELAHAREWNRRAELTHPASAGCRAVWIQRGFLARLAGDGASAAEHSRRAESIRRGAGDAVLEGRQFMAEGRTHAALAVFTEAIAIEPQNFWAIFYASTCHQLLDENWEALSGYDICGSLRPGFFGTYFNRGQVRLRLAQAAEAEADFDRALKSRPNWADSHYQRAMAREAQRNYKPAVEDLNRALELGYSPTAVLLVRSRVHGLMGEKLSAERDFNEAIETVPTDERGWMARAQARLFREPQAALADFEVALKINPRSISALQGKAHVLSEADKNDAAMEVVTRIIEINPDSPDAWSGRGVLRARLNDRKGALSDAREALRLTERPATKYQVAGIFATTSKTNEEDRREAFSLLDSALRAGFGFQYLDRDPELDSIRKDPEFKKLVDAAKRYRESLKKTD